MCIINYDRGAVAFDIDTKQMVYFNNLSTYRSQLGSLIKQIVIKSTKGYLVKTNDIIIIFDVAFDRIEYTISRIQNYICK